MAGLAVALARQGNEVVFVAEELMSIDRAIQGWTAPDLVGARLELASTADAVLSLVKTAPSYSIHICQGIRSNGLVGLAQRELVARGLRHWVVMETVEDSGWLGVLKRISYQRLLGRSNGKIEGVLATGHLTSSWVAARGFPAARIFPFAYFLTESVHSIDRLSKQSRPFRFVFVGQFVERKRLDLLISALAALQRFDLEIAVIGSGPLEFKLRLAAEVGLAGRVHWIGRLPVCEVPQAVAHADCLVLPSRHDGWGAVVSEALMVGTQTICSDTCGVAGVVKESGLGGIFRSGDVVGLTALLEKILNTGRLSNNQRADLALWARSLHADAGATYLQRIFDHAYDLSSRPTPPWER
jgi:glycosyltransferase involved in cell wall biosynthesis